MGRRGESFLRSKKAAPYACSTETAKRYPALAWYANLMRIAPSRRDMTIPQLVQAAQRALVLAPSERSAIVTDLARFRVGDVACPKCGAQGGHVVHEHHRFFKISYTCAQCSARFTSIQVQ